MTAKPQNLEVEQSLLGSLMVNNDAVSLISGILTPDHFSEPLHSRIYSTICKMHGDGISATPLTLNPMFDSDATMAELGGKSYLASLTAHALPIAMEGHARQIRDLAQRRAVIEACGQVSEQASNPTADGSFIKTISEHISAMSGIIADSQSRKSQYKLSERISAACDIEDRSLSGEVDINSIPTGLTEFDKITGGLRKDNYAILAGRPSIGKTAAGVQIALNAGKAGYGVGYFSLEMPSISLTHRCISSHLYMPEAKIPYSDMGKGRLNARQVEWMRQASEDTKVVPFVIDDRPGLNAAEVEAQSRVWASDFERDGKNLDLIVVDHLHKMTEPRYDNPVQVFTYVSARLAELSKKLNCSVLCLAQLNRGVEGRDDKRPNLSDLRESGSIEQDADTVIFCYRDSYYLERKEYKDDMSKEDKRLSDLTECRNKFELIIAKNRQGPTQKVEAWCDMSCNVIRDFPNFQEKRDYIR